MVANTWCVKDLGGFAHIIYQKYDIFAAKVKNMAQKLAILSKNASKLAMIQNLYFLSLGCENLYKCHSKPTISPYIL